MVTCFLMRQRVRLREHGRTTEGLAEFGSIGSGFILVLSWFVPTHRAAHRQGCKLPADCVKVKGIPLRQFY